MNNDHPTLAVSIAHFVDTDLDAATGACSYHYNYLVYNFAHRLGTVVARSYLDNPSVVSILTCPADTSLEDELSEILAYLRARYGMVQRLGPDGYCRV